MRLSEVFGPTIQGEGPSAGRRASFIRLALCNLDCAWCDTPYTWDWRGKNGVAYAMETVTTTMEPVDAVDAVMEHGVDLVVITGGEPLLQLGSVTTMAACLRDHGIDVEVETNGTIAPTVELASSVTRFNVSPKLPHSGVSTERAIQMPALLDFAALAHDDRACFKFVVQSRDDLDLIDAVVGAASIPCESVWVMPEGRHADGVNATLHLVADEAIQRGYNLSGRLHVEVWGDERGH